MDNILDILLRVAAMLLFWGLYMLCNRGMNYIRSTAESEELDRFITYLVEAADQMLKMEDPTGGKRLEYVQQQLIEAGYDLTDALRAVIESKVYKLNAREAARHE